MTASATPNRPLAGVRVLEMGALIAGPFCAKIFGEFGADVVKIEPPRTGDPLRKWRYIENGTSLWWHVQSRNKRSIAVDLRTPDGQAIARALALRADILVENFRPGTLESWNLSYESLAKENPGLVMVRISGYGQTGPYRERPGFGVIGEALGGLRYVTGTPDRPPSRVGVSIGDTLSALYGVIGAMMALHARAGSGRGQVVDVALYESVFSVMESMLPEFDRFGVVRERTGSILPGIAPTSAYRCADGSFVLIAANGDSIFQRLCRAMGRDDLASDASLAHNDGRAARQQWLDGEIEQWTRQRQPDDVVAAMQAADVPASRICTIADIVADAQYKAREMIREIELRDGSRLSVPGVVPKLSRTPGGFDGGGPKLGEHTDAVLRDLGYEPSMIADLRARRIVE
ncbi:MAG TPA: CaiB/BaiF CoA-transferase family protein [Casimicrobiaceae bacterium]|jgi:crotonobetainyl-CoA:carnitine CoA-transferase CaiB-like acyl-CoA transferase|nr:CaiB/BaiF CoA-transferase family protein [Casimicrobiaceae bacterium]